MSCPYYIDWTDRPLYTSLWQVTQLNLYQICVNCFIERQCFDTIDLWAHNDFEYFTANIYYVVDEILS